MKKYDFGGMPLDELWKLHQEICLALEKKITEEKRKLQHRLNE